MRLSKNEKDPIRALAYKTSRKLRQSVVQEPRMLHLIVEHFFDRDVLLALRHAVRIHNTTNLKSTGRVLDKFKTQCPRCSMPAPRRMDEETVRCGSCGEQTDWYEAYKAANPEPYEPGSENPID